MTELKHAAVIIHMAKHGFDSVEYTDFAGRFYDADYLRNPITSPNIPWRIKPATITYTVTVPEPMRVMPEKGDVYWSFHLYESEQHTWHGHVGDVGNFAQGNIWDTEAKALAAFDAMFGPLKASKS